MSRGRYQRGTLKKVGLAPNKKWQGEYHVYVNLPDGTEKRRDRTKILGPATLDKGAAQRLLDAEIAEAMLAPAPSGLTSKSTFRELWNRFAELKKATWGRSTEVTVQSIFIGKCKLRSHSNIVDMIGDRKLTELTADPLQAILNRAASQGRSESYLKQARSYLNMALDFAVGEHLISGNPASRLSLPTKLLTKKVCERFFSRQEVASLLAVAPFGTLEHLSFELLIFLGLRGQELLALRLDDIGPLGAGGVLRVDEAIKEKEKGLARIGEPKSIKSTRFIRLSPGLYKQIQDWVTMHPPVPAYDGGKPFLFASDAARGLGWLHDHHAGTPFRVKFMLEDRLKPVAKQVNLHDFTFQSCRRTFSTHYQDFGSPKDAQVVMGHASMTMTAKYMKEIPANIVDSMDRMYLEMTEPGSVM